MARVNVGHLCGWPASPLPFGRSGRAQRHAEEALPGHRAIDLERDCALSCCLDRLERAGKRGTRGNLTVTGAADHVARSQATLRAPLRPEIGHHTRDHARG